MGPYCKFCGERCFIHIPEDCPEEIKKAYGTSTIIATCTGGQLFEKEKLGYCYSDIVKAIESKAQVIELKEGKNENIEKSKKIKYQPIMNLPK